ncbi:MAG: hypothetical protein L3J93_03115 [Thermoplasmata archaeon]|nr:hypothetical protein [Thermoplasmata archaeon]
MSEYVPILAAGALSFLAGILIGVYIVSGGGLTLGLAAIGIAAAFSTPVLQARSDARKEGAETRRRHQDKYDRHACDLNEHVFVSLSQSELAQLTRDFGWFIPPGSGVTAPFGNPPTRITVEGLPNWKLAILHLSANPTLLAKWQNATNAARELYRSREEGGDLILDKVKVAVAAEYGPEMRMNTANDQTAWVPQDPPTCNVRYLAYWIVARRAGFGRKTFTSVLGGTQGGTYDARTAPTNVSLGGAIVLSGRNPAEGDAGRFQRVFDHLWADPVITTTSGGIVEKEGIARTEVQIFADTAREYSNRIATARTFEGDCEVCRSWTPRER